MEFADNPPQEGDSLVTAFWKRLLAWSWLPYFLAAVFISIDVLSGPFIQFPATFVFPVAFAAWFGNFRRSVILAVGQPMINLGVSVWTHSGPPGQSFSMVAVNSSIRVLVLLVLAYFIHRCATQNRELARRNGLLRQEIPTCFECKRVQDEQLTDWIPIDIYVARNTGANFTHVLCSRCEIARCQTTIVS